MPQQSRIHKGRHKYMPTLFKKKKSNNEREGRNTPIFVRTMIAVAEEKKATTSVRESERNMVIHTDKIQSNE